MQGLSQRLNLKVRGLIAGLLASTAFPIGLVAGADLVVSPAAVELRDAFARRQLLVESDGRDLTRDVAYQSANPAIAVVDAAGYLVPIANGTTTVQVTSKTQTVS